MIKSLVAVALAGCTLWGAAGYAQQTQQHQGVLGTSFEMTLAGVDGATESAATQATLTEIQRLEAILSTWRADSELSRLNTTEQRASPSPELREVLQLCEQWRRQTEAAFSCRIGSLIERWRKLEGSSELPDRPTLRRDARAINRLEVQLDGSTLQRPATLQWNVDAIAKGYILDRALAVARKAAPRASGIRIDIGGDAVQWGTPAGAPGWKVAVANPQATRDNGNFIATLQLNGQQGIAASGHKSRTMRVANRQWSHIIDPLQGWPTEYAPSAIVVAKDAATADALATALSVMPIRKGLDLIERIEGAQALLVSDGGRTFASSGWYDLLIPAERHDPLWPQPEAFVIDYEIPTKDAVNYRRPYLAVWVASGEREPLRQLLLLGDSERWMQEVRTWWRRAGRNDTGAIDGFVRPTRRPGQYSLNWDGRDDQGRGLPAGEYFLCIEAAREHGEREYLEIPLTLGNQPLSITHSGKQEIGQIKVTYTPGAKRK